MKTLISQFEDILNIKLDRHNYLLAGNAFGKKSFFLYKSGSSVPSIIVRIPQSTFGKQQCSREFEILEYLENKKIPNIVAPKGLQISSLLGKTYFFQEALPFDSLLGKLSLILKIPPYKSFRVATSALITIYHKTKTSSRDNNLSYSHCFLHGDFWLGNLGYSSGKLALLDLEFSVKDGLPLFDLLHFGLYYLVVRGNIGKVNQKSIQGDGQGDRIFTPDSKTVNNLLIKNSSLSRLMKKCILHYLKECDITLEDGLTLIKEYFQTDRGIKGLEENWEKEIFK